MKTENHNPVKKVLIVEDEIILAQLYKQVLTRMNIETIGIATNSVDAFSLVEKDKPDLIFMDIMIEGDMDGIDTTHKIQSLYNIPVLYLTASSDPRNKERALSTNFIDFLIKPIGLDELRKVLQSKQ